MPEVSRSGGGQQRFPSALVLEASVGQARFVCELMRSLGFEHVWSGTDSATGFADLHQLQPDLLVLALDVEPLDGFALARTVRGAAQAPLKDLPIIFLTPKATEHQVADVRSIRRSVLLVKPAERISLRRHIELLLRADRGRPGGAAPVRAVS